MSQELNQLFSPYILGNIELKNRVVMAPMTRSRAIGNLPNELVVKYYAERTGAGLLITEGTSPSPNGLGYSRIPGIFSDAQVAAWKKVTDAVHTNGGNIFMQLMHTGRVSHPLNMSEGTEIIAPSAIAPPKTPMWTDQQQMQPIPAPRELTTEEVEAVINEFVHSAENAIKAGFDGIEIHAANGYLPMQFLNTGSNKRTDKYGGSIENRNRFVLELTTAIAAAIGKEKTGVRLSPFGTYNDMENDESTEEQYKALVKGLNEIDPVYLHLVSFAIPPAVLDELVTLFDGAIMLNGGYTAEKAETDIGSGKTDLVSFGGLFISNPDLVERFKNGVELATPDNTTFFSADEKGYTDYPFAK
ncbi:MAG TPA: alkene reductase [Chitinophagaceae bacterium]|nr:alkene reductase [Chitinophagaceae bacterium]